MKIVVAICATCLVISCSAEPVNDEDDRVGSSCVMKVGATQANLQEVSDWGRPLSEGAEKVLTCMLKEMKVIVNGKFSPDGAAKALVGNLDEVPTEELKGRLLQMAQTVAQKCNAEFNAQMPRSEQELAVRFRACFVKYHTF